MLSPLNLELNLEILVKFVTGFEGRVSVGLCKMAGLPR